MEHRTLFSIIWTEYGSEAYSGSGTSTATIAFPEWVGPGGFNASVPPHDWMRVKADIKSSSTAGDISVSAPGIKDEEDGKGQETVTYDGGFDEPGASLFGRHNGGSITLKAEHSGRSLYYSAEWQVLEEREGSTVKAQNVWSPVYVDAMVLRDRDTVAGGGLEERLYAQHDANFNVTALVNTSGAVIERYVYDPYGAATVLDANWAADGDGLSDVGWVYLHQGGRYDAAAGLYHFRHRDYSPTLGRWVQQDPARFADGLSLYQYVRGNPGRYTDPTGEYPPILQRPFIQGRGKFSADLGPGYL
ncbi:MAG: RHS repeat-associated core domain-containing protein [Tepidisphaeraceae bacterium]